MGNGKQSFGSGRAGRAAGGTLSLLRTASLGTARDSQPGDHRATQPGVTTQG